MGTLSKLRRLVLRDNVSVRQAAKRLNISRNTARRYLAQPEMAEPRYAKRQIAPGLLDPYKEQLTQWLKADAHRSKRERRTIDAHFQAIRAMGYSGGKTQVYTFCRQYKQEQSQAPIGVGFVPLHFELGEAFQFDWSTEYLAIGGLRRRLEVAHVKLAASRAYVLLAYYAQAHEMLFDAHARAFAAFGGVPRRGIYDNMKTAVDKVGKGKARSVNARFEAMTGHYLFEADFCNVASGWEKGQVEKNVQDRRRHIWREASEMRWHSLAELNAWLLKAEVVDLPRSFERDQTFYDWQHYIGLVQRKPGALRNGAPFKTMPAPLQELQRQLLKNPGGDRVMAQVLSAVPLHGVEAVLVAVELALQAGRVSGEHVLNTLSRLKEPCTMVAAVQTPLTLQVPPQANTSRYDGLRDAEVMA